MKKYEGRCGRGEYSTERKRLYREILFTHWWKVVVEIGKRGHG